MKVIVLAFFQTFRDVSDSLANIFSSGASASKEDQELTALMFQATTTTPGFVLTSIEGVENNLISPFFSGS
jgi:hypothetical protein